MQTHTKNARKLSSTLRQLDMNTVKNDSQDLIFQVEGTEGQPKLIPVKTANCKLAKNNAAGEQSCCAIKRDAVGAVLLALAGDVRVNGESVQSKRLHADDKVGLADACYRVHQLGAFVEGVPESSFASGSNDIDSRFHEIQSELDRQSENFKYIDQRFDEMSNQISKLLSALNSSDCDAAVDRADLAVTNLGPVEADEATSDVNIANIGDDAAVGEATTELDLDAENFDDNDEDSANAETESDVEAAIEADGDAAAEFQFDSAHAASETDEVTTTVTPNEAANIVVEPVETHAETSESEPEVASESKLSEAEHADLLERLTALTSGESNEDEDGVVEVVARNSEAGEPTQLETELSDAAQEFDNPDTGPENEDGSDLEKLLASLSDQAEDAVVDSAVQEHESGEVASEDESPNELSADPESNVVDDTNTSLENLFASLNAPREETTSQDSNVQDEEPDKVGVSLLPLADSLLAESAIESEESYEEERFIVDNELVDDTQEFDGQIVESSGFEESETHVDESASASHQSSERKLLDQLRSLQREQQELVESEQVEEQPQQDSEVFEASSEETHGVDEQVPDGVKAAVEPVAAQPEQPEQESVAEVLRRMNAMPSFEESAAAEPQTQADPVGATPASSFETSTATLAESTPVSEEPEVRPKEEGSSDVQDYMNSLLQRLNGPGVTAPAEPVAEEETKTVEPVAASLVTQETPPEEGVQPLNPEEFVPKRVAPELNSDLAAMRELANASTRSAVKTSQMKRQQDNANLLLFGAAGAMLGAVCTAFLSKEMGDMFYWLAISLFGLTAVCSGVYAKNALLSSSNKNANQNSTTSGSLIASLTERFTKKSTESPEV